ncbi:MAG: TIGR04282 family arsenosugar biosynthesis glycosyltransferase [Rhodomicrobiaceae bacterium]
MVREPRLGAVKTRLAREIGPAAATRFYRSVTANLIRRLAFDRRWRTVIAVAPDQAVRARVWPTAVARVGQGAGDLGERMERLLRSEWPAPAILMGSDIPAVRPDHIAEAFALLRGHDAVFGPAEDGGFWLVGLNALPSLRGLFSGVRWSSPHALDDALANLAGRQIGLAARLSDVDDLTAYRRHAHLGAHVTPAPVTSLR